MENCKNCKYVVKEEGGCFATTDYVCVITDSYIDFPRLMGGSKKCVCYKRAEKQKDKFDYHKFDYPVLSDLEDYLQKINENQGDLF